MEHPMYQTARDMLKVKKLCPSLEARIARVIELIETVNQPVDVYHEVGTLKSSQVLAEIIFQWELQD